MVHNECDYSMPVIFLGREPQSARRTLLAANDVKNKKFAIVNKEVIRLHDDMSSLAVSFPATGMDDP